MSTTNKNNISLIFVLVIMISMIISGFIEMGDARKLNEKRHIGYGVIGSGTIPGCGPKKPNAAACKKTPANNYNRGCSFGTRCRRHPPALDT